VYTLVINSDNFEASCYTNIILLNKSQFILLCA